MNTIALRRTLAAAARAVAAATTTAAPGAAFHDGTSNTIMVGAVQTDQAHHRLIEEDGLLPPLG